MAYKRSYSTTLPIPRDEYIDDAVVVWLTRESFERTARSDGLTLTSFDDMGEVLAEDIPPKVDKQMGRPASDFVWRAFSGVGERAPDA